MPLFWTDTGVCPYPDVAAGHSDQREEFFYAVARLVVGGKMPHYVRHDKGMWAALNGGCGVLDAVGARQLAVNERITAKHPHQPPRPKAAMTRGFAI